MVAVVLHYAGNHVSAMTLTNSSGSRLSGILWISHEGIWSGEVLDVKRVGHHSISRGPTMELEGRRLEGARPQAHDRLALTPAQHRNIPTEDGTEPVLRQNTP